MKIKTNPANHELLKTLDIIFDFVLNFFIGLASYYIVFFITKTQIYPVGMLQTLLTVILLCVLGSILYNYHNVYVPMRTQGPLFFVSRIFLVHVEIFVVSVLVIILTVDEWYKDFFLAWMLWATIISFILVASKKITMLAILHSLRARNKRSIKKILLVTDSQEMADEYMEEIFDNPHYGYSVIGYVGNLNVNGLKHLGTTGDLDQVIKDYRPDEVVIALDTVRKKLITRYIGVCNNNCVKVMVVPAICGYFKSPRQISMLGNLPVVDIRSTPLDNVFNRFLKRTLDIVGSLLMILITSPFMIFTAIGVRLSSPGPILFRQTRVGRQNQEFTMYKFRSMRVNDSQQTGWSTEKDPRKTRFGAFIRKFALDELPQLFNVLKGDMSLVGPRPEVPFYVEQFRKEIPLYMLKHISRPGMTGQAQIKGLRGDTSIEARIEEDINYIENWTFWKDIRILLLTPFRAVNRHEKYAEREKREEAKQNARRTVMNEKVEAKESDSDDNEAP
ncbi:MAG: exopolysaccharide biosynthesis polyprenyl glycosylphosphotransferase [Clostridia bacterium]|nr:exopolysaccharide biosynthesis polyprenyl glycosylphosphotransferase [Clostridia bacterium]MBQ9806715.1 exopolysaccharide biosynthesis polyprenyl glycosylphosphotransferase [Clostridia bacterium]